MHEKMTLSVAAIKEGTVIDHIPAGGAWKILKMLQLLQKRYQVTLGLNLPSKRMGLKDLIKIEGRHLSEEESHQVAVYAPTGTINWIRNFSLEKKIHATLPPLVKGILTCPNPRCITRHEPIPTFFYVKQEAEKIFLFCKYCERDFERDHVHDSH